MEQKTYNRQTAKFLARVAENMPEISGDVMQEWIENPKALQRFLEGLWHSKTKPTPSWRKEDGVIYFSVTSDGTTGEDWAEGPEGNGFRVGEHAEQVLCSPDFKPTSGVTTEVAVLKGMLFEDNDRITKKIRAEAHKRKLTKPNAEVACLIREKFTDKDIEAMGLWWVVVMHQPIKDSDGDPCLLCAGRDDDGQWLRAYDGRLDHWWNRDFGFAFAVSPQ